MKLRHKKLLISGTALTVAGILGIGALMQTSVSVQASAAMMPGIETIVNETSKDEPFRILEIVDEQKEAEIGYYVSGQEPYFKLYTFPEEVEKDYLDDSGNTTVYNNITSVQDVLSRLITTEQRRDFMQNTQQNKEKPDEDINSVSDSEMTDRTGIKNIRSICNPDVNGPLSYIPYKETYFPNEEQVDWQPVDLAKVRKVQLNGTYEKSPTGVGDYSREDLAFYPVRKDTEDSDKTSAKYRENIESFSYSMEGKTQPYEVEFQGIDNQNVTNELIKDYYENHMGLYTNVYGYLTSTTNPEDFQKFPGEDLDNPFWEAADNISEEEALQTEELRLDAEELFNDGENLTSGDSGGVDSFSDSDSDGVEFFSDAASVAGSINPKIYRDEEIDYFPFHRYREVGTYSEVMSRLKTENAETVFEDNSIFDAGGSGAVPGEDSFYSDSEGTCYWRNPDTTGADQRLVYVIGREKQLYSNTQSLATSDNGDTGIPYYYFVHRYGLACELSEGGTASNPDDYRYTGWYYAVNPANEERFILAGENKPPHFYASDEEFTLTPGKGEYDFKPDEGAQPMDVQVNHFYYSGGYTNHDWLKQYVFNLHPDSEDETERGQFDNFAIEVDTIITDEFNKEYGNVEVATEEPQLSAEQQSSGVGTHFIEGSGEIQEEDVPPIQQDEGSDNTVGTDETRVNNVAVGANETGENQALDEIDGSIEDGQESEVEPLVSEAQEELVDFEAVADGSEFSSPEKEGESAQWPDGKSEPGSVDVEISDGEFSDSEDLFTSEEQSDFEDLFTSEEQSGSEQSIFSAGVEAVKNELNKYDLIYINGKLSVETAQILAAGAAAKSYACIINQDKVTAADDEISTAFSSYLRIDDADENYVSQNVYFFKNVTENEKSCLVNLKFHTDFSRDVTQMPGFEEIREYIENENQYRELGQSQTTTETNDTGEFSDGEVVLTDSQPQQGKVVDALSTEISQARVVEYILNYKYKRNVKVKDKINVLEIQPAKAKNGVLTEEKVLEWLGQDKISEDKSSYVAESCCKNGNMSIENILKNNNNNWVSGRGNDSCITKNNNENHFFTVKLKSQFNKLLYGIYYDPRSDNYQRGKVTKYKITVLDEMGNELLQEEGVFSYKLVSEKLYDSDRKYHYFKKPVYGASSIKFDMLESVPDIQSEGNDFQNSKSCRGFGMVLNTPIDIIHMTSSEYVGHIDDINSKYDLIYIGDDCTKENRNNLINGDGELMYTHVGGAIIAGKNKSSHLGLMDFDKTTNKDNQPVIVDENHTKGGVGSLRGSGNDITNQQYQELMDFVKSGYPVIIGSKLATKNDNGNININNHFVDSSSYIHRFLNEAKDYDNVVIYDDLSVNGLLPFFINLAKPIIDFTGGYKPPEPPRLNGTIENSGYITGEGLEYIFAIENDSEIAPATTTYDCELFLDLNFDGNLASNEEQDKYMQIIDLSNNQVLTNIEGKFELHLGRKYKLTRKIPYDYFKVITWKLQICSNTNHSVRTSVMGYAKRENKGEPVEINVLQIAPNISAVKNDQNEDTREEYGTWNLLYKDADKEEYLKQQKNSFQKLLAQVDDFAINIDVKKIGTQSSKPNDGTFIGDYLNSLNDGKNLLDNYDMIIIGFDDVFEDIPNLPNDGIGAVEAIKRFIQSGKSVIFAHDTTSYVNKDYNEYGNRTASGENLKGIFQGRNNWGYNMNSILRPIVGLDRYGITSKVEITKVNDTEVNNTKVNNTKISIGELLSGQAAGTQLTDAEVNYSDLLKYVGDVAYATNTLKSSFIETQGFTNWDLEYEDGSTPQVYSASKVNDGAVTQYPYLLGDLVTTQTHTQYYQLALEKDYDLNGFSDGKNDIVVWYCLSGGAYSNLSPNDVRNSYYFYSCGNVIYTGAGHKYVENANNNLSEKQLFVNAIIAAAGVTAVNPEVSFVKMLNPSAEKETSRYYMTDNVSFLSDEKNILEDDMEFYLNVKDYNMVSASLNLDDKNKQDMTVEFYIENEKGELLIPEKGETIPTTQKLLKITNSIADLQQYGNADKIGIGEDGKFHLAKNNAYSFTLKNVESYLYDETGGQYKPNCKLYVKVTSTVYLYGTPVKKSSWAVLNLKQRQLFDLD